MINFGSIEPLDACTTIFSKQAVFSEKTAKNRFGGAFDHFSGKGGSKAKN